MRFCPTCRYYLYLVTSEERATTDAEAEAAITAAFVDAVAAGAANVVINERAQNQPPKLLRVCRACGYQEEDTKGGLVLEMDLQEKTSEGYKILLNEFTTLDPTLPHVNTIKCPNGTCLSNTGSKSRDVIYLKYDPAHMKYLYICNVCETQWRSKAE